MKKKILAVLGILVGGILFSFQATKQITLAWDPAPVGEIWQSVRIYDISVTPEVLLATATCTGTPLVCPTTVSFTIQKKAYQFTARSWDGNWESANSNVVILPGPPSPPGGLKKP